MKVKSFGAFGSLMNRTRKEYITSRGVFSLCLRRKIYEDEHFKIFYVEDVSRTEGAFWGVFFSKKYIKKSAHRNRIRRLMKEFFRRWKPRRGCVLLMPLRESIYRLKYQEFEKMLLNVFGKAGILLCPRVDVSAVEDRHDSFS